jgi:predicted dehydrogenase
MNDPPITAILLGAGNRGHDVYGAWALAHRGDLQFVAVAEADQAKQQRFAATHQLTATACASDWRDLLAQPQRATVCVIALPDQLHAEAAVLALEAGYHLLLEKPLAHTAAAVAAVAAAVAERAKIPSNQQLVMLCHVLRYTPFFLAVKRVIDSGALGQVVTVAWRENVSSLHYSHSFVRGNWAREADSSPMILAKCCHDLDLLLWLLQKPVVRLSSFGGLAYFRPESLPVAAVEQASIPARCTDGCPIEPDCTFSALKIYLSDNIGWPTSTIGSDLSLAARRRALETGPYGRCVYQAGNDVVDHQVLALEFESNISATLTMHGHSGEEGRTIRIDGTKATLHGVFNASKHELRLQLHDTATAFIDNSRIIEIETPDLGAMRGHGGGDDGLMAAFVAQLRALAHGKLSLAATQAIFEQQLQSHLLAFAAERARHGHCVVEMADFTIEQAAHE